ncbi:hypothetical protein OnM2_018066 [Erysiphe neolycopersici]|uniref:Uncharacterized protein n=1 Tax=Erysiphe neolycopersici TaxID=212602 RepID=A0A420I463_9PEZI|nr:hypothetical protein OnM2_018066 [Erysiphe neolycopersici]
MSARLPTKNITPHDNALIAEYANRMMSQTTEEAKAEMRSRLQSHMSPDVIQKFQAQNIDPLMMWCRQHAASKISNERNRLAKQQQQATKSGKGLGLSSSMQPSRSLPPNSMIGTSSPLNSGNINSDYANFMGTVDSAAHKQQQGVIAQAEGQIVVPANPGSKIANSQPIVMPGLSINVNEQRSSVNPGVRAQPQQIFNPHQLQNQRFQHAQVPQQAQAELRMTTPATPVTTKTQVSLQGQSVGIGSSSVPPSLVQSPMSTLNAPMRTPQVNQSDLQSINNPNTQFVTPIDPRFMTGNQKQPITQQQIANIRANPNSISQHVISPNILAIDNQKLMQMDNADIPQAILSHPSMPQGFPPEVTKWCHLKHWALTNPNNTGHQTLEIIKNFQRAHFQNIMQRNRAVIQHARNNVVTNKAMINQNSTPSPGVAAPVAPMGPAQVQNPIAMMMNMNSGQFRQPTMADIQTLRNHPSGRMRNATDDQIRNLILRSTQQHQHQQQLSSANHQKIIAMQNMNQASQSNNMSQSPIPIAKTTGQLRKNTGPNTSTKGKSLQASKSKPPIVPAGSEPVPQNSPRRLNPSTVRQPPYPVTSSRNSSPVQALTRISKRTSNGDMKAEISSTSSLQPSTPQSSLQSSNNNARTPSLKTGSLTPQQLTLLTPEQRKKYESTPRHSQTNRSTFKLDDQIKNVQEQISEEALVSEIKSMDAKTKEQVQKSLVSLIQPTQGMWRALNKWFMKCGDVDRLKTFFRLRARLAMQFQDGKFDPEKVKTVFTISLAEIDFAKKTLNLMITDLRENYPCPKPQGQSKTQSINSSQGQRSQGPNNLQQQQQQKSQVSVSRSSHAAPVPSPAQATFVIGTPSPHGTPSYADKKIVNMDLHIPPRKKQKLTTNSSSNQASVLPAFSSPNLSNAALVTDLRKQSAESIKPIFFCSELDCDRNTGFEKELDLKQHMLNEHIRPNENPIKYAQDMLTEALSSNSRGQTKDLANVSQKSVLDKAEEKMTQNNSQQEQTNLTKVSNTTSTVTPMLRQTSTNQSNQSSEKSSKEANKFIESKELTKNTGTSIKESVQQWGQLETAKPEDSWANSYVHPSDLMQIAKTFEITTNGCMSDPNGFREATPDNTPESSKDGISEPNSDISDGAGLDMQVDLYPHSYMPFSLNDGNSLSDELLHHENEVNMKLHDRDQSSVFYPSFDDINLSTYDKRFSFDTHLFSYGEN